MNDNKISDPVPKIMPCVDCRIDLSYYGEPLEYVRCFDRAACRERQFAAAGPESIPTDTVFKPAHYTGGAIECIDAIGEAVVGLHGVEAFCAGNAMKYLWRHDMKNGNEDLEKAKWYIDRLIEERKKRGAK